MPAATGPRIGPKIGPRIGIALGGGSARGWAHVGVLDALAHLGVRPAVVAGTSIGAMVGAVYAAGRLDDLRAFGERVTWRDAVRMVDVRFRRGGWMHGERLRSFLADLGCGGAIEDLPLPFGAVATNLESGEEVWIRDGSIQDAVRASIALPGIFPAHAHRGRWLMDGGLCNPVPTSLCRALGADVVIGVDINTSRLLPTSSSKPSYFDALAKSVTIMQVQITRARQQSEPSDVLLVPELGDIGLLAFDRARDAIASGRAAVIAARDSLKSLAA